MLEKKIITEGYIIGKTYRNPPDTICVWRLHPELPLAIRSDGVDTYVDVAETDLLPLPATQLKGYDRAGFIIREQIQDSRLSELAEVKEKDSMRYLYYLENACMSPSFRTAHPILRYQIWNYVFDNFTPNSLPAKERRDLATAVNNVLEERWPDNLKRVPQS